MPHVIDVLAFKQSSNRAIFKEVAVLSLEADTQPNVFLYKPPFSWEVLPAEYKSSNNWLEKNSYGLCWEWGDIPYERLRETLERSLNGSQTIFCKGSEKKKWLQELLPTKYVYNIEKINCPPLRKLPSIKHFSCSNHMWEEATCAARNVHLLREWFSEEYMASVVRVSE